MLGVATMVAVGSAQVGCVTTDAVPIVTSIDDTLTVASSSPTKLLKLFQRAVYEAVLPQGIYTGIESGTL